MAELTPGSVVAGYCIEAIVGRGGMGVVYRATQLSLDRPVALKAIAPELAGDATFRERFKRESRLAASIEHPNVIPVYEAGEGDGLLYLTMRYIEGTDLRALIEADGALEPARAARLVAQVSAALAAAHRRGLMHRDVKPANVLIDAEGEREHAYLTDFGIARHVEATSGLTQTGSVLGTLDYLAPERMADGSGDARADVYALGCVLFQALTGSVPYRRDNGVAKMFAHLNAPVPDARELRPVPDALAELAMAAMCKEPDERIQSASELAERLLEAADTRSAPAGATLPAAPPIPEAPPTAVSPPPVTEPAVTEPAPTEPARTEPAPTEPARTEPAPTRPAPTERGRARRPRTGLLAGAAGVVVAAIVAVVVFSSGGSDDPGSDSGSQQQSTTPTEQAPAPLDPTPLEPVELQPGADGVATGGGFVWIANRELNTVTRVNAQSRRVEGDPIGVGTEPDSLAEGLGGMWVTNTSDNTVTQLDLGSGKPLGTHEVGAAPEGIVIARGSAWVANGGDGTVTRLDSGGNSTAIASVGSTPVQLAATSDAVWVTVSKENKIVELDLGSGQPTGRKVAIDGTPRGIAFEPSRGELWVSASAANTLAVVDPKAARVVKRVEVPDDPREVRFGLGAIWVTSATAQRVTAVDFAKRKVIKSVPIRGTTYGLAVGEGLAWAAGESEGLLLPVRPR